jgi:hypothetical protein
VSAEDVGVAPDQHHGTGDEQAPAEELILQKTRQGEVLLSGRGPAPEQVSDERQLHRRGGGKPQQVHGRQHDHLRRFDEQQDAEQLHRRELLARHAIERQQNTEQRRQQDEQHAHAVGRGMVGEHIEALGKLQDIAGHVDAGVEIDRHHQFGDRKQAPEDQRQVILAHDHQQHGGSQRQPLQRRQRRVAGLRGPEDFVHRMTTSVAMTINIR